jgi:hypothetical protein
MSRVQPKQVLAKTDAMVVLGPRCGVAVVTNIKHNTVGMTTGL